MSGLVPHGAKWYHTGMKRISLRRLRDTLPDIREIVEVERRDKDGNYQVLGTWTPYMTYPPEAKPIVGVLSPPKSSYDVDFHPVPKPARKK